MDIKGLSPTTVVLDNMASTNNTITINVADTIDLSGISGSFNGLGYTDITINTGNLQIDYVTDYYKEQEIVSEYREEEKIRERNPGIQAAWEAYKILVELAKNPPENLDESK